jgi:hypothetical protein
MYKLMSKRGRVVRYPTSLYNCSVTLCILSCMKTLRLLSTELWMAYRLSNPIHFELYTTSRYIISSYNRLYFLTPEARPAYQSSNQSGHPIICHSDSFQGMYGGKLLQLADHPANFSGKSHGNRIATYRNSLFTLYNGINSLSQEQYC